MTWDITWHSADEDILILKPLAEYTWEGFQKMTEEASLMIGRKPHAVHIIYDLREQVPLPGPGLLLQQREAHYRAPDNVGLTVLVGARAYTRAVTKTVYRSLRDEEELYFAETLEEALRAVQTTNPDEESSEA
jgi:hypothetical protein